MAPLGKAALVRLETRWARLLRNVLRSTRNHLLTCSSSSTTTRSRYKLKAAAHNPPLQQGDQEPAAPAGPSDDADLNVLSLKICILGDCQTGKTSFVTKYVGDEKQSGVEVAGLNKVDKIFAVKGAMIAFNMWDVGGENQNLDHVPVACKDSVAILIMFDLTNRCTLNNVISWYQRARRCNKSAMPILIGTKFDEFVQLPDDMQWTIANQARAYARAMKATLFFSSATHNINVNKIFKYVAARLFNLPWTVERNLNIGEPIIDF